MKDEYIWTCDFCGKEFDTQKESDKHEEKCNLNPKVHKKRIFVRITILIISFLFGVLTLYILSKLSASTNFGTSVCVKNSKLAKIDLFFGEIVFIIFNYTLFTLIKSLKPKNKIINGIKGLVLICQVFLFLLFSGIGFFAMYAYSEKLCETTAIQVIGRSMEPTFKDQQLLTEMALKERFIGRGCIILLREGTYQNQKGTVIKRVIGLPGDTVRVSSQGVYVNNQLLEEPYALVNYKNDGLFGREWAIPSNQYFILGDNRDHSQDSREYGPVNVDRIEGYVLDPKYPELNSCK